jgi:hypothetical protein
MVAPKFNVEVTPAGHQFVIPGTEKPASAAKRKYSSDGSQLVIPGAERLSPKRLLARLIERPLRPRAGQRPLAGTALFGKHPSG